MRSLPCKVRQPSPRDSSFVEQSGGSGGLRSAFSHVVGRFSMTLGLNWMGNRRHAFIYLKFSSKRTSSLHSTSVWSSASSVLYRRVARRRVHCTEGGTGSSWKRVPSSVGFSRVQVSWFASPSTRWQQAKTLLHRSFGMEKPGMFVMSYQ